MLMAATGVYATTYEAQGASGQKYATLSACLAEGEETTCTLLTSASLAADETITRDVVIDLNDKTLNMSSHKIIVKPAGAATSRVNVTVKNGTVDATGVAMGANAFEADGKASLTLDDVVVKGNTGTTPVVVRLLNGGPAVTVTNSTFTNVVVAVGDSSNGANTNGANVTITGTTINNKFYALTVNGTVTSKDNTVTLKDNKFTVTNNVVSPAIYAAGYANWDIESGTYKGYDALNIRSGKFNITGGTFEATGTYNGSQSNTLGRTTPTGSAVTVAETVGTYAGAVELTIDGGTFKAADGSAIYELTSGSTSPFEAISITNGTFIGGDSANVINITNEEEYVTGGTYVPGDNHQAFTKDDAYADGYVEAEPDEDGNVVVGKQYTIKIKGNVKVTADVTKAVGFGYQVPTANSTSLKVPAGSVVNLISLINLVGSPDSQSNRFAVKYVLTEIATKARAVGDKISGLTTFTMPESDVELELEIVEVSKDTELGEEIITPAPTPTPGTDENQGSENQGSENQGGTTDEDLDNPNTLDNVTSVAAMGGISLAIAAAGIATLKKREN